MAEYYEILKELEEELYIAEREGDEYAAEQITRMLSKYTAGEYW